MRLQPLSLRPPPAVSRPQKLRSLLARCPEWADDAARIRLADALDAAPATSTEAGGGRLTSCLRGTDTMAALRKVDLIALARGWGYRCHLWRRRRACSRVTQRALASLRTARGETGSGLFPPAATAPAAPLMPLEPFDARGATSASIAAYIALRLQPLCTEVVRLYRGEEARDTAVAHGWTHISQSSCDEVAKVYTYLSARHVVWQRMVASINSLRARLPANEVAFRALAGNDASEVLQRVEAMVATAATLLHRSVAAEAERRIAPNLSPSETAWLEEMHRARMMGLEMTARLQALLVNAKFDAMHMYLDTCVHVLQFMMNFLAGLGASFEVREAWMRRLLAIDSGMPEVDSPSADPDAVPIYTSPLDPDRAHTESEVEIAANDPRMQK